MSSRSKSYNTNNESTVEAKKSVVIGNAVPLKAYYDFRGYLVEISIIGCPFIIHKKVLQAVCLCLPFHPWLTKLTIRRRGMTPTLLREISKMLPHSNLTDVCLDDCNVPEGNYEILLEQTSKLKYLSLSRCCLGDSVCKNLAAKINFDSPGSSLLALDLGSNRISDIGAKAIGESLRRNRHLLHLNLAGNEITDAGAASILCHLMEFKLTFAEIVNIRQRKFKFAENKLEVFAKCYEEVLKRDEPEMTPHRSSPRKPLKGKNLKNFIGENKEKRVMSQFVQAKLNLEVVEAMTMDIVGKFKDPYDEDSVVMKDECSHSKGNMVLCSLNLAYNNLSLISIQKVYEVLKYQDRLAKPSGATGLARVVLDGNYIPLHCVEYDRIEMLLKKVICDNNPIVTPNRKSRSSRDGLSRKGLRTNRLT